MPERVFGRSSAQMMRLGRANLPIRLATCSRISSTSSSEPSPASPSSVTNAATDWPGVLVLLADHRGLGDLRVRHDRRLDLGRRHAVARDVEHVVDAPDDPEVAVLVLAGGVADEVDVAAELVPVGLDEAVVVAVERAQHARPRPAQREQPLVGAGVLAALLVDHLRLDARQRARRRARLGLGDARQRRDHDVARLGLPPGVDDRAALAADHEVVPEPRLRVDRLADRARAAAATTGRASPGTRRPTSCRRGSRSARCRRASRRSARRCSHQMSLSG